MILIKKAVIQFELIKKYRYEMFLIDLTIRTHKIQNSIKMGVAITLNIVNLTIS